MIEELDTLLDVEDVAKTARLAAGVVQRYGAAAIFHRPDTGVCAVLSRGDPYYHTQLHKLRACLVGVYAATVSAYRLAQWIETDLREHRRGELAT